MRSSLAVLFLCCACTCGSPRVQASDSELDFGKVAVSSTAVQLLRIENPSDAPLELRALDVAGPPFSVTFSAQTIPARSHAELPAAFFPEAIGPASLRLRLQTSAGLWAVMLRGEGVSPPCSDALPEAVDFGAAVLGQRVTRELDLHGGVLVAGALSAFEIADPVVSFRPIATGAASAEVLVPAYGGCPQRRVHLTGEGFARQVMCLTDPLDFGTVSPGATKQLEVTLRNVGTTDALLEGLSVSDPFSLLSSAAVPAGATAKLTIAFHPDSVGHFADTLRAGSQLSCALLGDGGGPDIEVTPSTLAFGKIPFFANAAVPSSARRSFTVRNTGVAPLHVSQLSVVGLNADSAPSALSLPASLTVAPGASDVVPVTVTPSGANQALKWSVTLTTDDFDEPSVTVEVTATSVVLPPCNFVVQPTALAFGRLALPDVRERTLVITNLGVNAGETCLITSLELVGDATFSLPAGPVFQRELQPGESLEVVVRAAPSSASGPLVTKTAELQFGISSPTASLRTVPVVAQVGVGCLLVSPRDIDFGAVAVGCASSPRTLTVTDICGGGGTVSSVASSSGEVLVSGLVATYVPVDQNLDLGELVVHSVQNGVGVDDVVTFRGRGNVDGSNVETFTVKAQPKVDWLIVRDDSGSMIDKASRVSAGMASLLQKITAAGIDFHLGVIYTEAGAVNWGVLRGAPAVLRPSTPNVAQLFASRIDAPLTGGNEEIAESAVRALTSPLIDGPNAGFLRADATLAIVAVTDAEQDTPMVPALAAQLSRAQGNYNVIGPFLPQAPSGCSYDADRGLEGHSQLIAALGGVSVEICDSSWSAGLDSIVARATGMSGRFTLATDPTGPIAVFVDGLAIMPVIVNTTVWTYDAATRTLAFEPLYRPDPGSVVTVTYGVACF